MSNLVLPVIIFFLGLITYSRVLAQTNEYEDYNYDENDDGDGDGDGNGDVDTRIPKEPEDPECECANIVLLDKNSGTKYS